MPCQNFGHPVQSSDTLSKVRTPCPKFGHPVQCSDTLSKVRTPCPKFGYPVQCSDTLFKVLTFTCQILHAKNNFATIVNEQSVLKLFQLSNGDFFLACQQHLQTFGCVIIKFRTLGRVYEVRACYTLCLHECNFPL